MGAYFDCSQTIYHCIKAASEIWYSSSAYWYHNMQIALQNYWQRQRAQSGGIDEDYFELYLNSGKKQTIIDVRHKVLQLATFQLTSPSNFLQDLLSGKSIQISTRNHFTLGDPVHEQMSKKLQCDDNNKEGHISW